MRPEHEPSRVVLIGPPGAGKGTQAEAISARLGVPHISTGDIFRRNVGEGTDLGLRAKSYMDSGALVPNELTNEMVRRRLGEDDADGFLLDGFPRNREQAEFLDNTLRSSGRTVDIVLELHVSAEEIVRRLNGRRMCGTCGRSWHVEFNATRVEGICNACSGPLHRRDDDREDAIRRRLQLYEQQTAPMLVHYQEKDRLVRVDASGPVDAVGERVAVALGARPNNSATSPQR
ncbi:adenylate kinase [Saccharopolyspora shandongensis]|uniref:adenylate kinase n=1 Tax=Saccharopolyspora shandongensis TaxID=418495 RepID=UPI003424B674